VRSRRFIYILFALSLVCITGLSFAWKRWPGLMCYPSAFVSPSNGEKHYLYPEKIVVKPWRGQHHVYGVFIVPEGYQKDKLVTLTISGNKTYCGRPIPISDNSGENIHAKPGYYLVRGYLNTRIALALIAQGKINELKQTRNWKLGYIEKSS
jgi:hypothetical protein